jgi:hypothetical protein
LTADASSVIYIKLDANSCPNFYRYSGGYEVALAGAEPFVAYRWFISSGYTVEGSYPADGYLQYTVWAPDGAQYQQWPVTNTSGHAAYPLRVRWPWVLYASTQPVFFDLETGEAIYVPVGSTYDPADFVISGGQLQLYIIDQGELLRWDPVGGLSTPLAQGAGGPLQADGSIVVWGDNGNAINNTEVSYSLHELPIPQGQSQLLSSDAVALSGVGPQLESYDTVNNGGLVAWQEASASGVLTIKAFDGQSTSTVSTAGSLLYGTDAGYVLFEANGQLIAANSLGQQVIYDGSPNQALIAGNVVYYTVGNDNVLYRAVLN